MKFRIREARKNAGYTQTQLAELLGIKNTTLSGYELGDSDPKSDTLIKIADICGCTVDFLLCNDKYAQESPISPEALRIAHAFDSMNEKGKNAVKTVVEALEDQ